MESGFRKDIFAIAVGTFLGAIFAHSLGYLWYLGVTCGGFMGYLSRLLTEPQAITSAGKRAWRIAASLHLPEKWQERVKLGFYTGVCAGTCAGILLGLPAALVNISDHGKTAAGFGINTTLGLYVLLMFGQTLFCIAVVSGMFLCDRGTFEHHYQKIASWRKWSIRLNPVSIHLLAVYYLLVGLAYAFWSLVWAIVHIPDLFRVMWKLLRLSACFAKMFFRLVHTERFTACGVYASLGAFLVFIFIPNQPMAMVASSIIFGYIGARARHFLLSRLNGSTVTS